MKIGLLGYGKWGRNWAQTLYDLGVLGTICDIKGGKAEIKIPDFDQSTGQVGEYIAKEPITKKENEVLLDSDIEAVVIATPPETHWRLAKSALMLGKDVLVEKPMTLSPKTAHDLQDTAKKYNRVLMTGHLSLFHHEYANLKRRLKGKTIKYLQCRRLKDGLPRKEDVVETLAPHDLAMVIDLLDMPKEVKAFKGKQSAVLRLVYDGLKGAGILVAFDNLWKETSITCVTDKGTESVDFNLVSDYAGITEQPLGLEAAAFIKAIKTRKTPETYGVQVCELLSSVRGK